MGIADETLDVINIIPDMVAWAEKRDGRWFNIADELKTAGVFPKWVFDAVDFDRVERLGLIKIVDCDPFRYVSRHGTVIEYKVLFFQSSPMCLLLGGLSRNKTEARWLNPKYCDFFIGKLLPYLKLSVRPSVDAYGQEALSFQGEHAFVRYMNMPYVRVRNEGVYENVVLERWDRYLCTASKVTIVKDSYVEAIDMNNGRSVKALCRFDYAEFFQNYKLYMATVPRSELPGHIDSTRFN